MTDPRLADHATGLELQIEELVVRRDETLREGWADQAHELQMQVSALQLELAETAEQAADESYQAVTIHGADTADHLTHPG
jgi:hypothetical protein